MALPQQVDRKTLTDWPSVQHHEGMLSDPTEDFLVRLGGFPEQPPVVRERDLFDALQETVFTRQRHFRSAQATYTKRRPQV